MNYKNNHQLHIRQAGFVSIVVTLIIMTVLSLIVLSFARQSRREQRQALDRQLSSQAFYAAESGINDAVEAIEAGYTANKTNCDELPGSGALSDSEIADGVEYSCLLIDQKPTTLIYDSVSLVDPTLLEMRFDAVPDKIVISWQNDENKTGFSNQYKKFPKVNDLDGNTGILRVALTKLPSSGAFTRASLNDNTYHVFLYPKGGSGTTIASFVGGDNSSNGDIKSGKCDAGNTPLYCSVTINNLGTTDRFFLSMRSMYNTSKVHIAAYNSSGSLLGISGAQAIIDSTGKASDVLKRLQVRVSAAQRNYPAYALELGSDICKRYELTSSEIWDGC